jgi:hypothetical protein
LARSAEHDEAETEGEGLGQGDRDEFNARPGVAERVVASAPSLIVATRQR